jgi:hypothetical protein
VWHDFIHVKEIQAISPVRAVRLYHLEAIDFIESAISQGLLMGLI